MAKPVLRLNTDTRSTGIVQALNTSSEGVHSLALDRLVLNPDNPGARIEDGPALDNLTESIREIGLLLPLLVEPIGDGQYMVIAGNRRLAATRRAGLTHVPVVVRHDLTDRHVEAMLAENSSREDFTPIEEALRFKWLLDAGRTQTQIAKVIGRAQAYVSQRVRLLDLPDTVQDLIQNRRLTARQGYEALTDTPYDQLELAGALFTDNVDWTWPQALHEAWVESLAHQYAVQATVDAAPPNVTVAGEEDTTQHRISASMESEPQSNQEPGEDTQNHPSNRSEVAGVAPSEDRSTQHYKRLAKTHELMRKTPKESVFRRYATEFVLAGGVLSVDDLRLLPSDIQKFQIMPTGAYISTEPDRRQRAAWVGMLAWTEEHIRRGSKSEHINHLLQYHYEILQKLTRYQPAPWETSYIPTLDERTLS